jgi:AcrR family transcriptional regulator
LAVQILYDRPVLKTDHVDGRAARSARTRDAVVTAFLDLVQAGNLRPTAKEVASRAGVSLRSVFQHFDDLETLFAEVADRQIQRLRAFWPTPPAGASFSERLAKFVAERSRILEAISPVRRAAVLQEPFSEVVSRRLNQVRDAARAEVAAAFAPELAGRSPADKRELLAALDVATNWGTWEALRRQHGMNEKAAARTMGRMVEALLKEKPTWSI